MPHSSSSPSPPPSPTTAHNRSKLREFIASIATIQGDLSNITAPPFVLGSYSTVELPQYWGDHPELFVAPASEPDPGKRAVLVLKWFLGSLRNQQYAGKSEDAGVKKPLNAFLGEVFVGGWTLDEHTHDNDDDDINRETNGKSAKDETRLTCEQVSHHPPITACHLSNAHHGIHASGFTQQEITLSSTGVSIKQKGYATLHIDCFDEDYLVPVPNIKAKGILSGSPYPELVGTYGIISSSGYVSVVKFEGKGFLGGGAKNSFDAKVFFAGEGDGRGASAEPLYTAKGQWSRKFSIVDAQTGEEVDSFDASTAPARPISVAPREEQDPWESRRAWAGVLDALDRGDMRGTVEAKSTVEQGQREMRRQEKERGVQWETKFFKKCERDEVFDRLVQLDREGSYTVDPVGGIWKVDEGKVEAARKPFHEGVTPAGWVETAAEREGDAVGAGVGDTRRRSSALEVDGDQQQQPNNIPRKRHDSKQSIDDDSEQQKPISQLHDPQPQPSPPQSQPSQQQRRPSPPQLKSKPAAAQETRDTPQQEATITSQFSKLQIEEMLRNRYSSSPRYT